MRFITNLTKRKKLVYYYPSSLQAQHVPVLPERLLGVGLPAPFFKKSF